MAQNFSKGPHQQSQQASNHPNQDSGLAELDQEVVKIHQKVPFLVNASNQTGLYWILHFMSAPQTTIRRARVLLVPPHHRGKLVRPWLWLFRCNGEMMSSGQGSPGGATTTSNTASSAPPTLGSIQDELLNQSLGSVVQSSLSGATIAPPSS